MLHNFKKSHNFKNHKIQFKINFRLNGNVSQKVVPGPLESILTTATQDPSRKDAALRLHQGPDLHHTWRTIGLTTGNVP